MVDESATGSANSWSDIESVKCAGNKVPQFAHDFAL